MRICFLEGDMSRTGGTERMTSWLANSLCKDYEVRILSLRMDGADVFFPLDSRVTHEVLPSYPGKMGILKQICWIHQYVKENNITRLINVDTGMGLYGILAAKYTKAKTITWEHSNYYNNWGSKLFPHMRRFAARYSDAVVLLTKRDEENYRTQISHCTLLHSIPNPVEPKNVAYNSQSKMILSVGHLQKIKGYHRVVEIASIILPDHPDWKWVICGEGPERENLETMIREAKLEHQISLPGLVQDMDEMYRKSAMVVLTSEMEGLSMVLLEGKSYSLPLVAFDIMTGPSDIIDDGINGFLIQPFDTAEMAIKIRELMENSSLRCQMAKKSVVGMEKFMEERILSRWQEVLEGDG